MKPHGDRMNLDLHLNLNLFAAQPFFRVIYKEHEIRFASGFLRLLNANFFDQVRYRFAQTRGI